MFYKVIFLNYLCGRVSLLLLRGRFNIIYFFAGITVTRLHVPLARRPHSAVMRVHMAALHYRGYVPPCTRQNFNLGMSID